MKIRIEIDGDRFTNFCQRFLATRKGKALALLLLTAAPVGVYATVSKPYTFTDGNVVSAAQINSNFDTLYTAVNGIDTKVQAVGTTYVRWGRTSCPTGEELVYDGYAAGRHYTHSGSGTNLVCLSKVPTWDEYNDGNHNGGLIYGLEYETSGNGIASLNGHQDYEAPCALCFIPRTTSFMLPGRNVCPSGWTTEYQGYLMTTQYQQQGSEFVCVDRQAEKIGSPTNSNGSLWYPVEGECGSLPCLPYVQDRELTCATCSR